MPLSRRAFGPLSAIVSEDIADAPTAVFFHGYGADAADLAPLSQEIPCGPMRWVFPDAPLSLGEASFGGRAWFPVDVDAIQSAQATGKAADFSHAPMEGFAEAARTAESFLSALGVPRSRLILGGFSQGAMLAAELALSGPQAPLGLVVLSGNLVQAERWKALAPSKAGLPFFQSHGIADPILGFQGALKLETLLRESGLDGRLFRFEGGHGIPPEVLGSLGGFFSSLAVKGVKGPKRA